MFASTHHWWLVLCTASAINMLAWLCSALFFWRCESQAAGDWSRRRLQLVLSAGYVFGCAYRSLLPVYDIQRLCLVDSWMSSVIVGRSVATVAELCFAAQWALMMREASLAADSSAARALARVVLPLIALAEICSWYSVLTLSNLGHVAEESLWGVCVALLVAGVAMIAPRLTRRQQRLLTCWAIAGAVYVAYMFGVDVPMYWARWLADEASGRVYLDVGQGVADASARWVVSHRWEDWKSEATWMSLYFTVAVWMSIAIVHVPRYRGRQSAQRVR